MPVNVYELAGSRGAIVSPASSIELRYMLEGSEDDAEIRSELATAAPATYAGLELESLESNPLGGGIWEGVARYSWRGVDSEFAFSIGGGSQRITQSIATVNSYAPSGLTAPDYNGAIGVSDRGVEGVEIEAKVFAFSETHYFADSLVTEAYKDAIAAVVKRGTSPRFEVAPPAPRSSIR
jgi:hypothetical protein